MPASDGRGNRLNYNGIEVYDVLTGGVSEEVVYDATNKDMIATKVNIQLNGLVSIEAVDNGGAATVMDDGAFSITLAGKRFDVALKRLNENRKYFIFWNGDEPLYAVWPIDLWHRRIQDIDDPNGDTQNFKTKNWWGAGIGEGTKIETNIVSIVSDRTARIEINLEFTYLPTDVVKAYKIPPFIDEATTEDHNDRVGGLLDKTSTNISDGDESESDGAEYKICQKAEYVPTWKSIASNNWRTGDNISTSDWLCERTISGELKILSKVAAYESDSGDPDAAQPISPHYLRFFTIPPLVNGFKRSSLSFTESEDNLSIEYTIKDKEVYVQPPWPSCEFSATASTSLKPLSGGMGSMPMVKCECTMAGRKHVDKKLLLQAMFHVINTKTNFLQTYSGFSVFVSAVDVSEELHANAIKASVEVMLKPDGEAGSPYASVMKFLTATFGQGITDTEDNYQKGDESRGLTHDTIPQKKWGASQDYHPQKARTDLQYPDDCHLLGPLSNLFIPLAFKGHNLRKANNTDWDAADQYDYIGNTPDEPIITYNTTPKKVQPVLRSNYVKSTESSQWHADNVGQSGSADPRYDWQKEGKTTNPSTVRQGAAFKMNGSGGADFVLGAPSSTTLGIELHPYITYNIHVEYAVKSGREMITSSSPVMPLTFPHSKTRPIAYKTYTFMAARINARPVLPAAEDFVEITSNLQHYLIDSKYNFAAPVPSANGLTMIYIASGTLVYALPRPHNDNEPIYNPTGPFMKISLKDQPFANIIGSYNFASLGSGTFSAS